MEGRDTFGTGEGYAYRAASVPQSNRTLKSLQPDGLRVEIGAKGV